RDGRESGCRHPALATLRVGQGNAVHAIATLQRVHHIHAFHHAAEHRVNAIEVTGIRLAQYDEELTSTGVATGVSHRQCAYLVSPRIPFRLALDRVAGTTAADPRMGERQLLRKRIATLHHEVRNHTMEHDSVEVTVADQ